MSALPLWDARRAVIREIESSRPDPGRENVPLDEALGRVLAEDVTADRDQPPFDRVTRDGFAVRAADVAGAGNAPVRLAVIGETLPGTASSHQTGPGECVEIMTGAALPPGADSVVMVEHTERDGRGVLVRRPVSPGENVVARGSELGAGALAFSARSRLDPSAVALLASLGCARPEVFARPRVAVIATGDELVEIEETPQPAQIRNSNRHSLAAQIARAGGVPVAAPIGRDDPAALRAAVLRALTDADLLLLSGGVSAGKYDFVESVLTDLGGSIVFDGVQIRPGRPLVFGRVRGKPFFGLPGNPLSTAVTFDLFARVAIDLLGGARPRPLRFSWARLAAAYEQRPLPLVALVPARFEGEGPETAVLPLSSQGSGDVAAMARADCWLVVEPGAPPLPAGSMVPVLPK